MLPVIKITENSFMTSCGLKKQQNFNKTIESILENKKTGIQIESSLIFDLILNKR